MINIHFTNGAGNNIFQYVFARLMAEARKTELSHPELKVLGISENKLKIKDAIKVVGSSKQPINYHALLKPDKKSYDLKVYPEDFTIYTPRIDEIKTWFHHVEKTNTKDLVFHLRLGDRLVMSSTYKEENYVSPEEFKDAIDSFDFEKLHIVTDMPVWRKITEEDVKGFTFHRGVKDQDRCNTKQSVDYFNKLYTMLEEYSPIVRVGNSVQSDFDYMRGFDKILFQHGTLSWWAAALSEASEVAVYGRWRGNKHINLGWADLPGWRQWGRPTAPARDVKEYHLLKMANKFGLKTFVETGTRGGMTLLNMAPHFDKLYSVEIIEPAFKKVSAKIRNPKIKLYLGDSGKVIKEIVPLLTEPALFWLDAHDNRNSTAIMDELDVILKSKFGHVLLIDDSRYFGTEKAYPTIQQVKDKVNNMCKAIVDVKLDCIRIFMEGE